jgi:hypothetical protein
VAGWAEPSTTKALEPAVVSRRFSTVVSIGRLSVLVMALPRQAISCSKKNHDLRAVRELFQPSSSRPAAPWRPRETPPAQGVAGRVLWPEPLARDCAASTVVPGRRRGFTVGQ